MLRPMLVVAGFIAALWSADALAAQLIASWTDNSGGTAFTQIERRLGTDTISSYTLVGYVPPGTTNFGDTTVIAGTTYCYRAFAYDAISVSPYSDEACATAASTTTTSTITVNVSKTGAGTGSVVSAPAGIDCGATCSGTYAAGSSITVSATPTADSTFDGWTSGGCSGTAPCTIVGNTAVTITASFSLQPTSTPPSASPSPTMDTTAPVVTLDVPASFTRKSLVTLSATASDDVGVARVDFYINGKVQCSDTGTPYTCNWRIPAAGKSYVLQTYAYDAAGNVGVSAKITVVPQ